MTPSESAASPLGADFGVHRVGGGSGGDADK